MPSPSDQELVMRVRQGEQQAYGDLVRRYQVSVFNLCYRLLGERTLAEDMAQEAFLRGYQRLETFDASRSFGPWIHRVAVNLCLTHRKKRTPTLVPLQPEMDAASGEPRPPEARAEAHEEARRVRRALRELSDIQRAVIELRHFQGLKYEEIAETLNLPLNTVKSHLRRARKVLAQHLTPS